MDPTTPSGAGEHRRLGGGLDPFANTTHYRYRGASHTLCVERITPTWERPRPDGSMPPPVNCDQCLVNRDEWITQFSVLEKIIEPRPVGTRRRVTSDENPGRGRFARPEHLQLCLECYELRGKASSSFDNLCTCDRAAWEGGAPPRRGDLNSDARLCKTCLLTVQTGSRRWSLYHCPDCKPAVMLLNRIAGRCVIPIGPHSIMNGVSWSSPDGLPMTDAQAVSFHDQLTTLFERQDALDAYNRDRLRQRAATLGLTGHAAVVADFRAACVGAGCTKQGGFAELVRSLSENVDSDLIWNAAHSDA